MNSQTIKEKIIVPIAKLAYMNMAEAKDFIYVYLDMQIKQGVSKNMEDSNIEDIFVSIAEKERVSVEELKKEVHENLRLTK